VYSSESYKYTLSALERARTKRDKVLSSTPSTPPPNTSKKTADKNAKKITRAKDDYNEAASNVAKKHFLPKIWSSLVFLILMRVLSLEYKGKVVALLPFQPWGVLQRITKRGLKMADPAFVIHESMGFDHRVEVPSQACGFMFIYILSTMSVKFIVNKALGTFPPSGAEKGFMTMMDDPRGQKLLQNLGVDTDELNEFRKNL